MSCGEPHETDCSEVLEHLYEYLDQEMPYRDFEKFREHFDECSPCLERYGLERSVKKLVKRCCGQDEVPGDLRAKVLERIRTIQCREAVPEPSASGPTTGAAAGPVAGAHTSSAESPELPGRDSGGTEPCRPLRENHA